MTSVLKATSIGIISNAAYEPSALATAYIQKTIEDNGGNPRIFDLEDLMNGRVDSDIVFNVYYGEIGDGGIVSGLLDAQGIKYIGNNQYSCSLMLNKVIAKKLFTRAGFATSPYWYQPNAQKTLDELTREIESAVSYPLLAKQVTGAASENISFLSDRASLRTFIEQNRAILDAGYYFFEQFISGREVSAGYINALNADLPIIEISLKGVQYQSNKVKFKPGFKENIIPAQLPESVYKEAQHIIKTLSSVFASDAFARADMMYVPEEQKLYLLEINTNPGLLKTSLLPLMAKHAGFEPDVFFGRLIEWALREGQRDK